MTDGTQELDTILVELCKNTQTDYGYQKLVPSETAKTKQAILDWHNKQIDQATNSVEAMVADIESKAGINHVTMGGEWVHKDEVNKQIEAIIEATYDNLPSLDKLTVGNEMSDGYDQGVEAFRQAIEAERNKLKESSDG